MLKVWNNEENSFVVYNVKGMFELSGYIVVLTSVKGNEVCTYLCKKDETMKVFETVNQLFNR